MRDSENKTWQHEITGIDGDAILFGVNIFDYDWEDTGKSVTVRDPLYGQEHLFHIYTVVVDGQEQEFASGEFSNCVWGFYLQKDRDLLMSSKSKFAVTFPPIYSRLTLVVIGLVVILNVMYTLFTPPPHIAMYGWFTALVFIPFTWMLIWEKTFKIEVDGTRISVRRRLGFVRYSFDISEIVKVEAKTVDSGVGRLISMRVYLPDERNLPIDGLLTNGGKLMKLIEASIDDDKIQRIYKAAYKKK